MIQGSSPKLDQTTAKKEQKHQLIIFYYANQIKSDIWILTSIFVVETE